MLPYLFAVALGLPVMVTSWSSAKQDLHDHANFVDDVQPRSHLTRLDVVCSKDHMTINMEFDEPFQGVVFSQQGTGHQRCVHVGPRAGIQEASFQIPYDGCGTTEDLKGQFHENTIVVQFGVDILEAWDEAKRLRCEWLESFEKPSSNQAVHIADLDVVELNFQGDDIECWMEVQEGKGPWARQVSGLVPLGSPLTLVIAINDHSRQFDMRVKQCEAHDETGSTIHLTDERGCVLRTTLLTPFVKVRDFSTRATLIAYSHLYAFKFPDHLDVYVRCTVEVCRHGCTESCPGQSVLHLHPSPREKLHTLASKEQSTEIHWSDKKLHAHKNLQNIKNTPTHFIPPQKYLPKPGRIRDTHPAVGEKATFHGNHLHTVLQTKAQHQSLQLNKLHNLHISLTHPSTELHLIPVKDSDDHSQNGAPDELQLLLQQIQNNEHILQQTKFKQKNIALSDNVQISIPQHLPSVVENKWEKPTPVGGYYKPKDGKADHWTSTDFETQLEQNRKLTNFRDLQEHLQNEPQPQPEPASFAHPHHLTSEELQEKLRSDWELKQFKVNPIPEPPSSEQPQPEPSSFAHPHHITSEELHQQQLRAEWKEKQLNTFPVKLSAYEPAPSPEQPQPEPSSFAHPHHITSEELHQQQLRAEWKEKQLNAFPVKLSAYEPAPSPEQPQPEPSSFAHPHHITSEELHQQQLRAEWKEKQLNAFPVQLSAYGSALSPEQPQPEPSSFAHPHHITSEELHQQQLRAEWKEKQLNAFPVQLSAHEHVHSPEQPQPEPSSFAHPHHITSEELQQQQLRTEWNEKLFEPNPIPDQSAIWPQPIPAPSIIKSTLLPYNAVMLRYTTPEPSTMPQPIYIPKQQVMPKNMPKPIMMQMPTQLPQSYQPAYWPDTSTARLLKPIRQHFPYPVPQFSPRQQIMLSVIADRRMDEDIDHIHTDARPPVVEFLPPTAMNISEAEDPTIYSRISHGPRNLRVRRSESVFGVQQKFRAIAPADLAFDLNITADNTAIFQGRREEVIYGLCMSAKGLSFGVSIMLFFTLCSTISAAILYQRSQILQPKKKLSTVASVSRIFNGHVEHFYNPGSSGTSAHADIMEIR